MGIICIDCKKKLTNRNKKTQRCQDSDIKRRHTMAHGRIIGIFCKKCNKELSYKLSKTLLCRKCWKKSNPSPPNKGQTGTQKAWNKGLSKFNNKEEYHIHLNKIRKTIRMPD